MAQEAENGGAVNGGTAAVVDCLGLKSHIAVEAPKASDAIKFFKAAFGAEEVSRVMHPKRKADQELPLILSAELKIGPASIVVSDVSEDSPSKTPCGSAFCLETDNIDGMVEKAVKAGAVKESEIKESDCVFFAERIVKLKDPYGSQWLICAPMKRASDESVTQ